MKGRRSLVVVAVVLVALGTPHAQDKGAWFGTLRLASEEKTGLTSANAVAVIPGQSAKRIIVNAHADGYFQAALNQSVRRLTLLMSCVSSTGFS